MYYEEKLIDGILHWRGTPDGEWQIIPAEKFAERVIAAEAFRATVAAALAALRADCEQQVFLIGGINDDYTEGVKFALKSLDATITKLGLEEAE